MEGESRARPRRAPTVLVRSHDMEMGPVQESKPRNSTMHFTFCEDMMVA